MIQKKGIFWDSTIREFRLGRVKGDNVQLSGLFGGGTISRDGLDSVVDFVETWIPNFHKERAADQLAGIDLLIYDRKWREDRRRKKGEPEELRTGSMLVAHDPSLTQLESATLVGPMVALLAREIAIELAIQYGTAGAGRFIPRGGRKLIVKQGKKTLTYTKDQLLRILRKKGHKVDDIDIDDLARQLDDFVNEGRVPAKSAARPAIRLPKAKFNNYIDEVERLARNRKIGNKQRRLLEKHRVSTKHGYLGKDETLKRRAEFKKKKRQLINEWERQTGQSWPKYRKEIPGTDPDGAPFRTAGSYYDAHEIIPNSYGGPQEWWNIHPARAPIQHQGGIHARGRLYKDLFPLD